jgi:hypothetical protein
MLLRPNSCTKPLSASADDRLVRSTKEIINASASRTRMVPAVFSAGRLARTGLLLDAHSRADR